MKRAERIADIILKLNPQDSPSYVLLSNIYATVGRFDDVERVRTLMIKNGVKKIAGKSSIEVDGEIHSFVVHDKSHENSDEIYSKLEWIISQMKQLGYVPKSNSILHDVEDEQKEELICYHSEKLAIIFGLLKLPPNSNITITKNLRVCEDCHTSTKLISQITKRDIIVRDSNRFHHFKEGNCSCNDYF